MTHAERERMQATLDQLRKDLSCRCPPDCDDCQREEDERAEMEGEARAEQAGARWLEERGCPWDDEPEPAYEPWDDVYAGTAQEYDAE